MNTSVIRQGNLAVIMTTQSHLVEDAVVEHYWNDIRLPALKRESLMLHDAYAAAARTNQTGQDHVGFDPFFEAVIEFKKKCTDAAHQRS